MAKILKTNAGKIIKTSAGKVVTGEAAPSSYQVTFTASDDWNNQASGGAVWIYDGQSGSGIELFYQRPPNKSAFPMTFTITSGYCYVSIAGCWPGSLRGCYITTNDYSPTSIEEEGFFTINKNGTIDIAVHDFDD